MRRSFFRAVAALAVLLATHALLPEDLKCQPGPSIVVSVPANAPNANAGLLGPGDIERLKLDSDLIVLSACNTAGPSAKTGESLSGLARLGDEAAHEIRLMGGTAAPAEGGDDAGHGEGLA